MTIDATPTGVSEPEEIEQEEQEITRTKRDEDFEALVAARNKEREQEEPMQFGDIEPEQQEEEEPGEDLEPEPDNSIIFYGEDGNEIKLSPKTKIKLKIDGQEQEESLEQMTRSYQKGVAADKRLETAAQRQKELQQLEQQLIAKGNDLSRREQFILEEVQKLQASEKKKTGLSKDAQEENLKKAKALFDAMVDSEDPVNKLASVIPLLTPEPMPQIDLETIRNEVKTEIRTEQANNELNKARKKFVQDFPELAKDPELYYLVNERTKWLQDVRPNADFWEIIKEAAEGVEARFVAPVPQPESKPDQPSVTPRIPTPRKAGGRSTIGKDSVPQTREQILAEMKKSRVQTAL